MLETRMIDALALQDVAAWEQANRAKVLQAAILGDGQAAVTVLPVADVSWYVNVWNCRADLVIGDDYAGDLFDLDAAALDALTDQVICEDHGAGVNMSGLYYPLSDASRRLYSELMETARPKGQAEEGR